MRQIDMDVMGEYRITDLMNLLKATEDKNVRGIFLQSYISTYGAIPAEYDDEIRNLLR